MSRSALPGAALLHLLLLAALGLISMRPLVEVPPLPESRIDVELLTPGAFDAMTRPKPVEAPPIPQPVQPAPPSVQQAPAVVPPSEPDGMIRASRMMAAEALANPLSRQAREMLPHLAADERIEQLCGIEAMSQIHAWKGAFAPDRVTAYARSDVSLSERALRAEGAVFRSGKLWYDLRFTCEFSRDRSRVVAFEFRVGEPVPRSLWRELNLPEIH